MGVHARNGAGRQVAHVVHAALHAGQAHGLQARQDGVHVLQEGMAGGCEGRRGEAWSWVLVGGWTPQQVEGRFAREKSYPCVSCASQGTSAGAEGPQQPAHRAAPTVMVMPRSWMLARVVMSAQPSGPYALMTDPR